MSANNKKKEEPKYILKKDFENRCPYCGSNKIERFGAFGTGGGSTSKLPNLETEVWSCKECKRIFNVSCR